jgi:DNA-binding beta-propeller fold protein YncE
VFSQPRSIGFDPANNRVIVADSDLDALIAIDITTGDAKSRTSVNLDLSSSGLEF